MKIISEFKSYPETVTEILNKLGADKIFASQQNILIKPNLVESQPPPVTTPVQCCEAIINYIRKYSNAKIVIAEGCGAAYYDTEKVFKDLGYEKLSRKLGISLVNLNTAETVVLKNKDCSIFPEFHIPEIAMTHYIISVPVLKAHSLSVITGTLKNMMGFAPPKYYQCGGYWKKSVFHNRMQESIIELNRYRTPDFTVMDATIGLAEYHLGGARCNPPVNKLIAGFDSVEVDRTAAELLGFDWHKIPHLH